MSTEKTVLDHSVAPHEVDLENRQQKLLNEVTYAEEHATPAQTNALHQKLKSRHMQMIAIGGSIGAGLFVGSGGALHRGGPASLLIGFGTFLSHAPAVNRVPALC